MTLLSQLFLTSSDFPNDWWTPDPLGPNEACSAAPLDSGCESAEARRLFFYPAYPTSGSTIQTIHVYYTEEDAAADFERAVNLEFQDGHPMRTDWARPFAGDPDAGNADEATLQCRIPWPGFPRACEYIGRYDEFIVIFYSVLDALNLSEFQHVIHAIDARMAAALPATHNSQLPDQ
jgi:hypothetical protein